jgi:glycosyltransferase involved in cell wall biosynthesis
MKFVAMLRVKNEERWIERSIKSLFPLCSHVYILNDHSTDATAEIARSFYDVSVFDSPFDDFSETRDKQYLLQQIAAEDKPDFVICIDGDEELEPAGEHKIRSLCRRPQVNAAFFRVIYLWDEPNKWRTDGIYSRFSRPSLFRFITDPRAQTFRSLYGDDTTLHCTNVPSILVPYAIHTDINLLHWGYFDKSTRIRKYEWYNQIDPNNDGEDQYRHMVIGDLFPSESQFKHGGPLTIEPLAL